MIHILNKKADFDLMLNMTATRLFGTLKNYWNCNSRTYLWYVISKSNNPNFINKISIIGFSSDKFSDSRRGLVFGEETKISEIRKEYSFISDEIEEFISYKTSIYEFQIGR